jgi:hypothetical protein
MVYRPDFSQGVFPEVRIFGRSIKIDQHCLVGSFQQIFIDVNSGSYQEEARIRFVVDHPGESFWFTRPSLKNRSAATESLPAIAAPATGGEFPIGIYAARIQALDRIQAAGFNVVQSYGKSPDFAVNFLKETKERGLGCLLSPPRQHDDLNRFLDLLERHDALRPRDRVWFYINDEPELRSVPPAQLAQLRRRLLEVYPRRLCATAMVRPHRIPYYKNAADIFIMDQYPIPKMPLTWLSDSIDEARSHLGDHRVWAVIQAFGGGHHAKQGWTRRPTLAEMRALSFLAVIHGVSGLFFYSYPDVSEDPSAWENLKSVVNELRRVESWLPVENLQSSLSWKVEMTSPFRADARGRDAIHLAVKDRRKSWYRGTHSFPRKREILAIAVNVIDRPVRGRILGWPSRMGRVIDRLSGKVLPIVDGSVQIHLPPFGVALLQGNGEGGTLSQEGLAGRVRQALNQRERIQ